MQVDMPMKFAGSIAERDTNLASHSFDPNEGRCIHCDCRPWGRIAEWVCGANPPRVIENR